VEHGSYWLFRMWGLGYAWDYNSLVRGVLCCRTGRRLRPTIEGVAVGTIIADCPPHRAVRAALPHTAPTLEDFSEQCCYSHTAQSLGHSFPALCRGLVWGRTMFSLARALFSPGSAEDRSSLFVWFIDSMARSDSSRACASAVWLWAFADRPRFLSGRGAPEVSRFSCML
jgi:hypothetical protein